MSKYKYSQLVVGSNEYFEYELLISLNVYNIRDSDKQDTVKNI